MFVVCSRCESFVVRSWLLDVYCVFFVVSFRSLILLFVFCVLFLFGWLCVVLRVVFGERCFVVCRFLLFGIVSFGVIVDVCCSLLFVVCRLLFVFFGGCCVLSLFCVLFGVVLGLWFVCRCVFIGCGLPCCISVGVVCRLCVICSLSFCGCVLLC